MKDFYFPIISSLEDFSFQKPLKVRSQTITKNVFLRLQYENSSLYLSTLYEINPQFHQRSLVEIQKSLHDFFKLYSLNFNQIKLDQPFFNTLEHLHLVPESRFYDPEIMYHIEVTILFAMNTLGISPIKDQKIKQNELATSSDAVESFLSTECLKFKITPKSLDKDLLFIEKLQNKNPKCLWRFDGNRLWNIDQLITFCEKLPSNLNIDYFEDPFLVFSDRFLFEKRYPFLLALDENVEAFFPKLELFTHSPIVIKPSQFGISPLYQWMIHHPKQRVIISSSYEHPSAMLGLKLLAQLKPSEFHGLANFIESPRE